MLRMAENGYWLDDGKYLHRVVYEEAYGSIKSGWIVHHIDGVKTNNEISNLIAVPHGMSARIYRLQRSQGVVFAKKYIEDLIVLDEQKKSEVFIKIQSAKKEAKELSKRIRMLEASYERNWGKRDCLKEKRKRK
jgi:hypothetical protein